MHIPRHHLLALLTVLCLLPAARANAAGDTIKYPEKAPVMTFTVPAGWEHMQGDDATKTFLATAPDDDVTSFGLVLFDQANMDDAATLALMPTICLKMAADSKITDPQTGQATKENFGGGMASFRCTVNGQMSGHPATMVIRWFKVGGHAYMTYQISPSYAKYSQAFNSIIASFKLVR